MNAYHVFGIVFAAWAVVVSFLGITREDFPASGAAARAVGAVSVLLAIGTIGMAIYTSATEEHDSGDEEEHALVR